MTDQRNENQDKYFRIHIDEHEEDQPKQIEKKSKTTKKTKTKETKGKRSIKDIFEDAFRQIVASAVILVIGFFLLNYSAYIKIFENKWRNLTGTEEISPLTEIVELDTDEEESTDVLVYTQEVLELETKSSEKTLKIPELELELAPSDNRIIIPRINQNIPIVRVSSENLINRDWKALENDMQEALKNGVVHYPGTSLPGKTGNTVITGHSSYFPWDPGRFKDVFAVLDQLVLGDRIVVYYDQDKFTYEVKDIDIVLPSDIEVLKQTVDEKLTLITCTPVGTNLKRLIISAEPIAINGKSLEGEVKKIKRT